MIHSRYDLPKVKLRFKTDPSNSIINSTQTTHFQKFDANPSVFLDRLKNGKQIHEAYMRYRKLKKHNYIKYPSTRKKSYSLADCQKMNTMVLKRQCKRSLNKLSIALQTTFIKKSQNGNEEVVRKNKFYQFANHKNDEQYIKMQALLIDLKPEAVSLKAKTHIAYQPTLHHSMKNQKILQEAKNQYKFDDQNKYRVNRIIKNRQQSRFAGQSHIFKIDPWNSDKILFNLGQQDKYHYENDEF